MFSVLIIVLTPFHILFGISSVLFRRTVLEKIAEIVLPILTIFFFKRFILWYFSEYYLSNSSRRSLILRNRKLFLLLNHFNVFFDLFLLQFVCMMRVVFSAVAAAYYMPRLDYSIFGRYLEKKDMGFISFVTFLHMEVNRTHPVKLSFCKFLLRTLKDEEYFKKTRQQAQARNKWFLAFTLR
jgi:hypothetical protein